MVSGKDCLESNRRQAELLIRQLHAEPLGAVRGRTYLWLVGNGGMGTIIATIATITTITIITILTTIATILPFPTNQKVGVELWRLVLKVRLDVGPAASGPWTPIPSKEAKKERHGLGIAPAHAWGVGTL